jgi:hypothetical protein
VKNSRRSFVLTFVTLMLALGMTAAEESVTVPTTVAKML